MRPERSEGRRRFLRAAAIARADRRLTAPRLLPTLRARMTTNLFTLSTMSPAHAGWLAAAARMEGSFRIANHVSKRNRPQGCFPMTD